MADITISDLELAPALADDMVLAVENTTDTYAATLAMLRRLINKTFVEVENADFNALTDDGFYQCTGTPTNSPVAGAINWTLQVSAENGVVVQRAFSLDDNFANLYIRRWNGVTWTGWLEVGAGALANKANVSNTVTTDTAQTISGVKTFTGNAIVNGGDGNGTFTIKNDVTDYGTSDVDLVVATSNGFNQFLVHFQEGNKWCASFEQDPSTKYITFSLIGCEKVLVPMPATTANDAQAATTAWVNAKVANVSAISANASLSNLDATGQAKFDAKANINLDNLSATGEAKIAGSVPIGSILPYGGSTAPTGWLLCNGGAISRTTYAGLFSVIGTSYGAGDGSTTFNLPNGKVPMGVKIPVYSLPIQETGNTYLRMGSLPDSNLSYRGFRWVNDGVSECLQAYRSNAQDEAVEMSIPVFHFEASINEAQSASNLIIKY